MGLCMFADESKNLKKVKFMFAFLKSNYIFHASYFILHSFVTLTNLFIFSVN